MSQFNNIDHAVKLAYELQLELCLQEFEKAAAAQDARAMSVWLACYQVAMNDKNMFLTAQKT